MNLRPPMATFGLVAGWWIYSIGMTAPKMSLPALGLASFWLICLAASAMWAGWDLAKKENDDGA